MKTYSVDVLHFPLAGSTQAVIRQVKITLSWLNRETILLPTPVYKKWDHLSWHKVGLPMECYQLKTVIVAHASGWAE